MPRTRNPRLCAVWVRLLTLAARIVYVLALAWKKIKASRRAGAVRADPAGEWVRKFGGLDERSGERPDGQAPAPGPKDPGRDGDQ